MKLAVPDVFTSSILQNGIASQSRNNPVVAFLLADTEFRNDSTITLNVLLGEIVEKAAAMSDHLKKSKAAVIILLVNLKVLSQLRDTCGEDCNLNLGRARVSRVGAIFVDNDGFLVFGNHSVYVLSFFTIAIVTEQGGKACGIPGPRQTLLTAVLYHKLLCL